MNSKDVDSAVDRNPPEAAQPCCRRGRKWVWFVLIDLLVLIAIGAGWGYWSFFGRIHNLVVYQRAMQTIQSDQRLQQVLGRPIQSINWPPRGAAPSAQIDDDKIEVRWGIQGPKGRAKAHLLARLMQGKWEFIIMEVTLPDGKKVSLADDDAGNAPRFEGPKPDDGKPKPDAPPPEINMPTPDVQVPR